MKKNFNQTSINVGTNDPTANDPLWLAYIKIGLIVSLYWFVSITMVFLNKQILSGSEYSLNAPLFITWYQCLITLAITIIGSSIFDKLPRLRFRLKTAISILPLTIVFVSMITFNNLCLKHVGVAFYFVGRSLTTVFNVILTYLILGRSTSPSAIGCCAAIVFGFLLGIDQEQLIGTLSISGILYGILASLFVSLNSINTVNALAVVHGSIWTLTYYNNLLSCIIFIPLMLFNGELYQMIVNDTYTTILCDGTFWIMMTIAGFFGFAIGYVTNLQISYTSPLSHNISGTAKACAQTVIATYAYNETKTFSWWISNIVVLLASAAYT
ncbi:hypothetical protein BLOT_010004, partial [Blomia tropicalis]